MKKTRFTDEQIAYALRQAEAEAGVSVKEVCRKLGVSGQTFYRWKKKYAGLGVAEFRRLRQLEEEDRKLKTLVADLSLDKQILQDALKERPQQRVALKLLGLIAVGRWSTSCRPQRSYQNLV